MSDIITALCTLFAGAFSALVTYFLSTKKKNTIIEELSSENKDIIKELKDSKKVLPKDMEIIEDVDDVLQHKLLPIIREKAMKKQAIKIQNFGLDLHSVMPFLKNKIIHPTEFDNTDFDIKTLIINPDSIHIRDLVDGHGNISSDVIRTSIDMANKLGGYRDLYKFRIEMRQYDLPPIFHGFILNDEHLFVGFTEIEDGKMIGGTKPYLHLCRSADHQSEFTDHFFTFFHDWFNHYWNISKQVAYVKR